MAANSALGPDGRIFAAISQPGLGALRGTLHVVDLATWADQSPDFDIRVPASSPLLAARTMRVTEAIRRCAS